MGSQRVYAGARLADIDRRRARGCLWQGAHARARLRPVRSGVRGLRAGAFARLADRCPRRAGSGRSDRHPCQPRPDRGHLSARGAESGDRRMGRGIGSHHRRRSCPGRLADRDPGLAIRVLDQPAARARRSGSSAGLRAERWPHPAPVRRDWRRDPRLRRSGRSPGRSARSAPVKLGPPRTLQPRRARCSRSSLGLALSGSPSTFSGRAEANTR